MFYTSVRFHPNAFTLPPPQNLQFTNIKPAN